VLTDLSFLEINQNWVPDNEKGRIALYELNNALYRNDHSRVLDIALNVIYPDKSQNENVKRIFINLYRSVSKLWSDLLFSEDPKIKSDSIDIISGIIFNNSLWNISGEVAIDVSRYGSGIYKLRRSTDGKAIIEANTPRIWFPVLNPDNINEVQAHVLGFVFVENKVQYLKVEIHTKGQIEHRLYIINPTNNKIQSKIDLKVLDRYKDLQEFEQTNVDDFLVIPVHNFKDSESPFGEDDYTDIDPIVSEIECQLTKFGQDLKEQGNLKYGPKHAIDKDGHVARNGYIGLMGGTNKEDPPGVVTWTVAHEAIKTCVDQLMFFFYIMSETSPAILDPDFKVGNLSGVAIKRLMQRTILKSSRLAENFDKAIKKVITVAAKLEGREIKEFEINWQDGLVSDMLEKAQTANVAIAAGTMSKKTGVSYVQELEDTALDNELTQIQTEKKEESAIDLDNLYNQQ
jgi:hypothetical protein